MTPLRAALLALIFIAYFTVHVLVCRRLDRKDQS